MNREDINLIHKGRCAKADCYTKNIMKQIIKNGSKDINPRPHYADGTPAHTYSINHAVCTFDLRKEVPIITLRPIAIKSAIGELLWIYQDQSNNLDLLKEKYGVTWWDSWDIGDRTIGACYGETVRRHGLMDYLLEDIQKNPDGRYHIINLWQVDDFKDPHGLKPCCYQTVFNVVHKEDGDFLDMSLFQRSSDFATSSSINWCQYAVFQHLVARHCGYKPGNFTWFGNNVQLYDRHIDQAKQLIHRRPIACFPFFKINPDKTDFYSITMDDISLEGYPYDTIKTEHPQLKFPLGI